MSFVARLLLCFGVAGAQAGEVAFELLDVRSAEEFSQEHVEGARLLDVDSPGFQKELEKMDRQKTYKVYCKVGGRAKRAKATMDKMGFSNVEVLGGVQSAASRLKRPLQRSVVK